MVIATWLFCRRYHIRFYDIADRAVIPVAVALGFGRITNFINAEMFGTLYQGPFCVDYARNEYLSSPPQGCRHPVQLYEMLKNWVLALALWLLAKRRPGPGVVFWSFIGLYGMIRFFLMFLRVEERVWLGLTGSQLFSGVMAVSAVLFLAWLRSTARRRFHDRGQAAPARALEPSHRRALWVVILLNGGFSIVEMAGGFVAGSQALKADSLDFAGDALITFLGLVAYGWRPVWRVRAALLQGLFLGGLGISVMGSTVYRALNQQPPEAAVMGVLGFAALAVNVAAAVVLIPHRSGDVNARAIWLFSRNDAIGNAVVVVAAGLVLWTRSGWPDLAAAFLMTSLFLSSAFTIVRDALRELRCPSLS